MRRTVVAVIVICAAIYLWRVDNAAGLIIDDAWYILLAKALASGDGFRLISSATAQILPTVPPGFPAMLAPVFWFSPSFPGNLFWLKLVSMLAMAVAGVACYVDYTRNRALDATTALWLTAIVVLTPSFVFLATSTTMSECAFFGVQMLALLAIERAARDDEAEHRRTVIAGVLAAATYLVRVTGLALIAAAVGYFVTRRRYRQASVFAAIVVIGILPWEIYARTHQPTFEERQAHGGTIAYPYSQLVAMDRPGSLRWLPALDRVKRAGVNVAGIVTRDIGAVIVPAVYRGAAESGEEVISVGAAGRGSMGAATGTMVISAMLTLIVVIGIARMRAWVTLPVLLTAATVVMMSAVGSLTFRYILPLAPFLVLYFWRGIAHAAAARIAVMTLLALHLIDHATYLIAKAQGRADWINDQREVDEVLNWLNTQAGDGAVASTNPPLVYLRTGRKGIYLINADQNWDRWLSWNVRYLASLQPFELPGRARRPGPVLQTGRRQLWVVEMNKSQSVHLTRSGSVR